VFVHPQLEYWRNRIKVLFFLVLLTCNFNIGFSQTEQIEKIKRELKTAKGKEEVDLLNKLGVLMVGFNPEESLINFLKADKKAEKLGYTKGIAFAKRYIGQIYIISGDFEKAKKYYEKSLHLFKGLNDVNNSAVLMCGLAMLNHHISKDYYSNKLEAQNVIAFCKEKKQYSTLISAYILAGDIEYGFQNVKEALSFYTKAANLSTNNKKDVGNNSGALSKLASLYHDIGDNKKAYSYQLKAVKLQRETNSPELPVCIINLGKTLDDLNRLDDAEAQYREALKIAKKYNNEFVIALASENLGRNLLKKKKYTNAQPLLENCLEIYKAMNNKEKVISILELLGNVYLKLNQLDKANNCIVEGIANTNNLSIKAKLYFLKSQLLEKQFDFKNALEAHKKHLDYKDSVVAQSNKMITEVLLLKYDTELKESENKLLKKNLEFNKLQVSSQKNKIIYLILGLLLLVVAFLLLYILFKSKIKTNEKLAYQKRQLAIANSQLNEAIQTKDKFFSILSHDLRDPVISMQSFSKMIATKYDLLTEDERRELIEENVQSSTSLFNLLEELLLWAKCQTGKIYPVYERFELSECFFEIGRFHQSIAEKKDIELVFNYPENIQVSLDKNMLMTIVRNLVSNAIKFSNFNSSIHISLVTSENEIELTVADQGIGMSENEMNNIFLISSSFSRKGTAKETGSGLGLNICNEFTNILGGKIFVKSEKGNGTIFTVRLPSTIIVKSKH
jgi:signal transduction histidine kinase